MKKIISKFTWEKIVVAIMTIVCIVIVVVPCVYYFKHDVTRLELLIHFKWLYGICLFVQFFLFYIMKRLEKI